MPSSATAVGYGWSRILNAPEPPPPHSVVAGKEVQVFKIKNLVFGLKIQSLFIGGSNTSLFISRVWKEFLWWSYPSGPSFSGFGTSTSHDWGLPGGSDGKEYAYHAGDLGLIPGSERSPGEGFGNPLQYSCLENPLDRGDWQLQPMGGKELDTTEQMNMHSLQDINQLCD